MTTDLVIEHGSVAPRGTDIRTARFDILFARFALPARYSDTRPRGGRQPEDNTDCLEDYVGVARHVTLAGRSVGRTVGWTHGGIEGRLYFGQFTRWSWHFSDSSDQLYIVGRLIWNCIGIRVGMHTHSRGKLLLYHEAVSYSSWSAVKLASVKHIVSSHRHRQRLKRWSLEFELT